MPDDLAIYIWSLIGIAVVWFLRSFISAAGKDAWCWFKHKFRPPQLKPIEVEENFSETITEGGERAWVRDAKSHDREAEGYTYYPHPNNGEKCFRRTKSGDKRYIEWLMVKPNE